MFSFPTDLTPKQAVELQKQLQNKVKLQPLSKPISDIRFVAGADMSFNRFSPVVWAGFVVLSFPDLQIVETKVVKTEIDFPYISGLLSFREIPALLLVWQNLVHKPDVVVLDGQGIAHPRRLGIASHFGLVTGVPSFGSAKSVLVGKFVPATSLETQKESEENAITDNYPFVSGYLRDKNEIVAAVVQTKAKTKPIYVSPGHLIDLNSSVEIIKKCTRGYRIPEPTRLAHLAVNESRKVDINTSSN